MLSSPVNLDLRQTIAVKSAHNIGFRIENVTSCGKGFILVGSYGHVSVYDRTDEKRFDYTVIHWLLVSPGLILGIHMLR